MPDAAVPPPPERQPEPPPAGGGGGGARLSAGAGILIGALLATVVAVGVVFALTRDSSEEEVTLEASASPPPSPSEVASSAPPSPSPSPSPSQSPSKAAPSPSPAEEPPPPSDPVVDPNEGQTSVCGPPVPQDAQSAVTDDLDGDGRGDLVYRSGRTLWVETAARLTSPIELQDASGRELGVAAADATGDGASELFVTRRGEAGSAIVLLQVEACGLFTVDDVEGDPFIFQVGVEPESDVLLGLGCVDVDGDGATELVGTRATLSAEGGPYDVERTIVTVQDGVASVGPTDTVQVDQGDQQAVDTLDTASCGQSELRSIFR